jgi:hypothetical protein
MEKILLTHPNLINVVDEMQDRCSARISGSTDYKRVLAKARAGEIEKLGIVFEIKGIGALDLVKQIYTINPVLPILAWDCSMHFENIGDYPELLEDHIFFIDSMKLKQDPFFEVFDKFFSEETLTEFDFTISERV